MYNVVLPFSFINYSFELWVVWNICVWRNSRILSRKPHKTARAVMLQELVAHPTKLHSRCSHALFIIGELLAYIVSIHYRACLCEVTEAVCEKNDAWKEIEKTKETGNQPDSRIYTHTLFSIIIYYFRLT